MFLHMLYVGQELRATTNTRFGSLLKMIAGHSSDATEGSGNFIRQCDKNMEARYTLKKKENTQKEDTV